VHGLLHWPAALNDESCQWPSGCSRWAGTGCGSTICPPSPITSRAFCGMRCRVSVPCYIGPSAARRSARIAASGRAGRVEPRVAGLHGSTDAGWSVAEAWAGWLIAASLGFNSTKRVGPLRQSLLRGRPAGIIDVECVAKVGPCELLDQGDSFGVFVRCLFGLVAADSAK
jgi:hypothetical protein